MKTFQKNNIFEYILQSRRFVGSCLCSLTNVDRARTQIGKNILQSSIFLFFSYYLILCIIPWELMIPCYCPWPWGFPLLPESTSGGMRRAMEGSLAFEVQP